MIRVTDALAQGDFRAPTQCEEFLHIEQFARGSVRLGGIKNQFALKPENLADGISQLANGDVLAVSYVNDFR